MALLENELKNKCKEDPKLIWPVLFRLFIDDGFGVTTGLREDIVYWVEKSSFLQAHNDNAMYFKIYQYFKKNKKVRVL